MKTIDAIKGLTALLAISLTAVFSWADYVPADSMRFTTWNPGLNAVGGIPDRSTVYSTIKASDYGNGTTDASAAIQAALNACPAGQVVLLSPGTFMVNGPTLSLNKDVTLRGAGTVKELGTGGTFLKRTNGAVLGSYNVPDYRPIITIGPLNVTSAAHSTVIANLVADGNKGDSSITLDNASGFSVGDVVLLDELSGASWQPDRSDPDHKLQVWASEDYRVVHQAHRNTVTGSLGGEVPCMDIQPAPAGTTCIEESSNGWNRNYHRPTAEAKEISSIAGNTVTFSTPLHINYRLSHKAQLINYNQKPVMRAGVENLTLSGGTNGNIMFNHAAYCWAKNIESTMWYNPGVGFTNSCFRCELRDSYLHQAAWPVPGGGGYALGISQGASEILVENNIIVIANKVIAVQNAGAGTVFGYNYTDDSFISGNNSWPEVGLNGSHFVGPHHILFEGNYGSNFDSDFTHGNAIYHTIFRNWLRGMIRPFTNLIDGQTVDNKNTNNRCAGAQQYSYWMTFVGNILGAQGQMTGWVYEATNRSAIWRLGWGDALEDYRVDSMVAKNSIREGNWDWVQGKQSWDTKTAQVNGLQNSLYLKTKPAFFGSNPWPWVHPETGAVDVLPAMQRFLANAAIGRLHSQSFPAARIRLFQKRVQVTFPQPHNRAELCIVDLSGRQLFWTKLSVESRTIETYGEAQYEYAWPETCVAGIYIAIVKSIVRDGTTASARAKIAIFQ